MPPTMGVRMKASSFEPECRAQVGSGRNGNLCAELAQIVIRPNILENVKYWAVQVA